MFLLERGRRSALIDGEFGVVIYIDVTCEIVPDMEIVLNCPQFPTKSFNVLHLNNPLRRLCIRIVLNP